MPQSRRTILRRGLILGSVGLTGCVAGRDDGDRDDKTPTPTDDETSTETRLWLEAVSLSESERDDIDPIVFGELSSGQKEIVRTAIDEEEYTTEMGEEPPELAGLREAIEARVEGGTKAYLRREDTYYAIGFVSGDYIIASPD